jgi:hypothetical protein
MKRPLRDDVSRKDQMPRDPVTTDTLGILLKTMHAPSPAPHLACQSSRKHGAQDDQRANLNRLAPCGAAADALSAPGSCPELHCAPHNSPRSIASGKRRDR